MNRLEHVVSFKTLGVEEVRQIMQIELGKIQQVMFSKSQFVYQLTDKAKDRIMAEGYSTEYGARELKRKLEHYVRLPLANLVMSGEIAVGDCVVVEDTGEENFEFSVQPLKQTSVTFKDLGDI
jgi:ATP-dependent Clp protease ATP-binding subunit ClpA